MLDSDTESEPENSLPKWHATDFADVSAGTCRDSNDNDHGDRVSRAIETLSSIDLRCVVRDVSCHVEIQQASSAILTFINAFISEEIPLNEACQQTLSSFGSLLNLSFICLLLDYRKAFHSIAAKQNPPCTAGSSIICWVDVILSQISVAVVSGRKSSDRPEFAALRKQQEDDTLRAAAQLPHDWKNVLSIISSGNASPAASRLALRLTFAVHVVGSQISALSSLKNYSEHLQGVLNAYIHRATLSSPADSSPQYHVQERANSAMMLSLFAEIELLEKNDAALFRPHTSAVLLQYLQHVLLAKGNLADLESVHLMAELDLPQRLLIHWGHTVRWSWLVWDDERIIGSAVLTLLNATWMYHIGNSESGLPWDVVVSSQLVKSPDAAAVAITMLLKQMMHSMTTYVSAETTPQTSVILYKTIWMTTYILNPCNGCSTTMSAELIKCLFALFVLVHNIEHEDQVRDMILHGISFLDTESIRSVLDVLWEDNRINFSMKVELVISDITRFLSDPASNFDENASTRQILMFLAISWNSGRCLHLNSVSSLLSSLVDRISGSNSKPVFLQSSLLTALSCLENAKSVPLLTNVNKSWEDEAIWQLALRSDPTNLLEASAFANYIISTAKNRKCSSLCFAEAWDYLRDTLSLILTHHFLGDHEPLALLVVGSVCQALSCLLRYADAKAKHFMIASPWTTSLCACMNSAVAQVEEDPNTYAVVLKERLSVSWLDLKTRLSNEISPTRPSESPSVTPWCTGLMFCRMEEARPCLILIPK